MARVDVQLYVLFPIDIPELHQEMLNEEYGKTNNDAVQINRLDTKAHPSLIPHLARNGYMGLEMMMKIIPIKDSPDKEKLQQLIDQV